MGCGSGPHGCGNGNARADAGAHWKTNRAMALEQAASFMIRAQLADITMLRVDAIVNAANEQGPGTKGAVDDHPILRPPPATAGRL